MTIFVSAADPKGDKVIKGKHQENVRIHVESTRGTAFIWITFKEIIRKRAKSSVPAVYIQMISNQKQTGVLPGKDPCGGRHYALNYFVNFICSPSIAQRPLGFSRSYFSQHPRCCFERPSFFSLVRAGIFRCYD